MSVSNYSKRFYEEVGAGVHGIDQAQLDRDVVRYILADRGLTPINS